MTETKPFPLNAWYAAAWSHEIKRELAARTICDKDVVLYRRTDGEVAALEDACWHRLLPLSLGHLKDDQVVCGYHGLVFNSAGRCTYMPAQKTIRLSSDIAWSGYGLEILRWRIRRRFRTFIGTMVRIGSAMAARSTASDATTVLSSTISWT
jgi:phenylpropionate dioxygenase-like ring-hydroxylating dioxygenase large terminal subunit